LLLFERGPLLDQLGILTVEDLELLVEMLLASMPRGLGLRRIGLPFQPFVDKRLPVFLEDSAFGSEGCMLLFKFSLV
jgi:hypothetical protein